MIIDFKKVNSWYVQLIWLKIFLNQNKRKLKRNNNCVENVAMQMTKC